MYHWEKRSAEGFRKAIEYFRQSIGIDPEYAPAYAALVSCYGTSAFLGLFPDLGPEVKAAALKAVELDQNLAEAHIALGHLRAYEFDRVGAEREYKRAVELNPSSARAHYFYGNFLSGSTGRQSESLAAHQKALELDPLSLPIQWALAMHSSSVGRYDEAIEKLQKTLELEPSFDLGLRSLSEIYYYQGKYEESLSTLKKQFEFRGDPDAVEALEQGYRESGYEGAMRAAANRLVARSRKTFVRPGLVAVFYVRAGEKDLALDWLEKAYEGRDIEIVNLRDSPQWDPLRSDPRFQEILQKLPE
jgi:tetratricopeptide (TPR) repeat protein